MSTGLDIRGLSRARYEVNVSLVSYDINNFDKLLLAMLMASPFLLIAVSTLSSLEVTRSSIFFTVRETYAKSLIFLRALGICVFRRKNEREREGYRFQKEGGRRVLVASVFVLPDWNISRFS